MGSLDGRVAVVMGGSSGFGLGIAKRFCEEGAKVVISARSAETLQDVAREIGATPLPCDLTSDAALFELAEAVTTQFGGIQIAVNSAGFEGAAPVAQCEPELVEPMVATQFTGALYFIKRMANAMAAGGGGSLITISSLTATLVAEGYAAYAGAKAGINHVTKIAASEYGAGGVRINAVAPSLIETPMTAPILSLPGVEEAFTEETPLGRMGTVEDVVESVLWLASDASSYITGQNLLIDGGTSLRRLPRNEQFMRHAQAAAKS